MKQRLEWWLETKNILGEFQFGLRRGDSKTHAIGKLVIDIELNFTRNNYLTVLSLDLTDAYNSVDFKKCSIMTSIGIPANISKNTTNLYRQKFSYKT